MNPDAEPNDAWLEELRRATLRHRHATMFGSTQIDARRPDRVDGFGDVVSIYGTAWRGASGALVGALPADDREVFAPCAAAALYARDAFLAAGGFEESFFCYLEDVDLGFRLRLGGARCIQVRRAEVRHMAAAIAGEDSAFSVFHRQRNRIWLIARNVPSPLVFLVLALQIVVVPLTVGDGGREAGARLCAASPPACAGFPARCASVAPFRERGPLQPWSWRGCSFGIRARRFATRRCSSMRSKIRRADAELV